MRRARRRARFRRRPSFVADLHIHSRYSRACSRDLDSARSGLVGAAQGHHPARYRRLHPPRVVRAPARAAWYRPSRACSADADRSRAAAAARSPTRPVRFMLSVEISTIYKRDDRTRKVHHLIYLPDFEAAGRFNDGAGPDRQPAARTAGRSSGLDSRDLLEITLESSPDGYLVPAHIWTPWFSALGSKSGFDAIADCYADLADHIFAVETGLSSDPEMNWRVSSLDRYRLVSNSDAHSPPALAREATLLASRPGLLRRPRRAADRRRARRHHRVLPRGGQVPRRRAPRLRRQLGAGPHPGGRRPLPGVRQAADRRRAVPGRGPGRPRRRASRPATRTGR